MCMLKDKKGFTAVEVIVVVSIIAVILSMVIGVGRHIMEQARRRAAKSTIDIIVTAVEQYYDDNKNNMPFYTTGIPLYDSDAATYLEHFKKSDFESELGGLILTVIAGEHPDVFNGIVTNSDDADWSSEALYHFLDKSPNSRRILSALNESFVTSLDNTGTALEVEIADGLHPDPDDTVNMLRFIDPWGNSFRYRYNSGDSFCIITSAGPDGDFATAGDNVTNR